MRISSTVFVAFFALFSVNSIASGQDVDTRDKFVGVCVGSGVNDAECGCIADRASPDMLEMILNDLSNNRHVNDAEAMTLIQSCMDVAAAG